MQAQALLCQLQSLPQQLQPGRHLLCIGTRQQCSGLLTPHGSARPHLQQPPDLIKLEIGEGKP